MMQAARGVTPAGRWESAMPQSQPIVIGIDAGGTMTDTILVDQQGGYTIGKAATTPHDEALGFIESADEAAETWGLTLDQMFPELAVVLYSGTGMLNTLLSRTGRRLGLITTRGMEDMVLMGRGLASVHHPRLHETMISGPIGGILGAKHVGDTIGTDSIIVSDNHRVSRYGDIGVSIMELGLIARTDKVKPRLIKRPLGQAAPDETASRGRRAFYHQGRWHEAQLWEMDLLLPGNEIKGPAIVEHPATTLVIPPGDRVWVDEWTILHYQHA